MSTWAFKFASNARHKDNTPVRIIDLAIGTLDNVDDRLIRARYVPDRTERQSILEPIARSPWIAPWSALM